jgi:hypothetical protein
MMGVILKFENGGFGQEFEDGFAAAAVPNFVKPAIDQQFVLFGSGKGLRSGRHITSRGNITGNYIEVCGRLLETVGSS